MAHYRVCYLDDQGRVAGRFEFLCTDDAEAELACEALEDSGPKQLWCGGRWIRSWPGLVGCDAFDPAVKKLCL